MKMKFKCILVEFARGQTCQLLKENVFLFVVLKEKYLKLIVWFLFFFVGEIISDFKVLSCADIKG